MATKFSQSASQKAALSPLMVAAWIVALPVLTVVSVVNLKLASTPFFFVARNLSPVVLAALWIVVIIVALLVITVLVGLARKAMNARHYRIFVGFAVFAVGLFFLGNVVANSSGITSWQPFIGGPIRWMLLIAASVVTGLVVLFAASGLLTLLSHRRVGVRTSRSDILSAASQPQTAAVLALLWVLILGYLLANPTLIEFQPFSFTLGRWGLAALAAGIFAVIVWRLSSGGLALLGIAGVVAVAPLVLTVTESDPYRDRVISYKPDATTPNILWIVVDELQSPALFDADGKVLEIFPNLAALQERSTTYSNAYMTAPKTDVAVPTMLNGIADPNALSEEAIRQVQRSSGALSWLSTRYHNLPQLDWFDIPINPLRADNAIAERQGQKSLESIALLAKDSLAVTARITLHPRLAEVFPELEGRWTNFWDEAPKTQTGNGFDAWTSLLQESSAPLLAFWHYMGVHVPLVSDLHGERLPVGWDDSLNWTRPTSEAEVELTKRLYLAQIMEFDRKLGQVLDALNSNHTLEDALIIISSDHGRSFIDNQNFRWGETVEQRWSEVARVPLIIKYPGQRAPSLVEERRSNGQIVGTILELVGVDSLSGPPVSAGLAAKITPFPSPYGWSDEEVETWFTQEPLFDSPHWSTDLLPILKGSDPFHIGAFSLNATDAIETATRKTTVLEWNEQTADSNLVALQVTVDPSQCVGSEYGYVKAGNRFIGSVIWTEVTDDNFLGWGLIPSSLSGEPEIWCP